MSQAASVDEPSTTDEIGDLFAVEAGDDVRVAIDSYEWSNPLAVLDVDEVEWETIDDTWRTREIVIEGGHGARYVIYTYEEQARTPVYREGDDIRGYLERFEHVEETHDPDEEPDDPQVEGSPDEDSRSLDEQIVDVLDEHGELPGKEIKTLLGASDHFWNVLSELKADEELETRKDPDDGRRTLYSLPTEDEDEESETTFPRECHCGETLHDTVELAVHRTEEHGVPQAALNHLEPGEFEEIVREAEVLQDVVDEVGWSRGRTLRVIGVYGLADALGRADEGNEANEPEVDAASEGQAPDEDLDEPTTEAEPEQPTEPADEDLVDLSEYGSHLDAETVIDAITGAQAVFQVQRDLRLGRESTRKLLNRLGLLDTIKHGTAPLEVDVVRSAVEEVVR